MVVDVCNTEQQKINVACSKAMKVDSKNRSEWVDRYMFILLAASSKPLCLKCNESMTLIKCVSVKQHCETKHWKSPVRARRITELAVRYDRSTGLITHLFTAQQHANTYSLTDRQGETDRQIVGVQAAPHLSHFF